MNLEKIYLEEDLFPREITEYEKRSYGYLFYNMENKDSYDSNHAIIFKEKINNLDFVLKDIIEFYSKRNIRPIIYESIRDEGYLKEVHNQLEMNGFEYWAEEQKYMILLGENNIVPNTDICVKVMSEWNDEYGTEIFEKAGEPWGSDVVKRAVKNDNTLLFIAFYNEKPVGISYCHITNDVCRVNYLLVSKDFRNRGVGRTIIHSFAEYCNVNNISNCYLWPDGETAEKIYKEAGFCYVETKYSGRAIKK